jgi:hypothetical protein
VIVPPYVRRSPKVSEVLPLLYLCMAYQAEISSQHWRSSSAPKPVSPLRPSPGLSNGGEGSASGS